MSSPLTLRPGGPVSFSKLKQAVEETGKIQKELANKG